MKLGRLGAGAGRLSALGVPLFTPVRLFADGQQGVWYEPKPTISGQQILYQDSAATTPVTSDGDPVGLMRDLSGNDNHATQATSAARPLYRTDGTLHWLEFDGVDDRLTIDSHSGVRDAFFQCGAARQSSSGALFFTDSDSGRLATYLRRDDAAYFDGTLRDIGRAASLDSQDHVVSWVLDSSTSNGDVFTDGTFVGSSGYTRTDLSGEVYIGANSGNNAFSPIDRIYGLVIAYSWGLSESKRESTEQYLAKLGGIQL